MNNSTTTAGFFADFCPAAACTHNTDFQNITPNMLPPTKIVARGYQTELLAKAVEQNVIIALGTGSGKTHIATMLLEEYNGLLNQSIRSGGKRAIFLVPSVPLVYQQAQYVEQHTLFRAGRYCGKENVDGWDVHRWSEELENHHVLVMVGQVFANALTKGFLSAGNLCLLIVDECHHVRKGHPYRAALHNLAKKVRDQSLTIRVIGLTASVINIVIDEKQFQRCMDEFDETGRNSPLTNGAVVNPIEKNIRELEDNMLKAVVVQPKSLSQVDEYGALPSIIFHEYKLHAVDDELLLAVGGRGRPLLQQYDDMHLLPNQREIIDRIESMMQYTQLFLMDGAKSKSRDGRPSLSEKLCKVLLEKLRHLLSTYKVLGVLALFKTIDSMLLAELDNQRLMTTLAAGKFVITFLQSELRVLCRMLVLAYDVDQIITKTFDEVKNLCSPAVLQTLELLRKHEQQCRAEKRQFSAIVFVCRRYSAWALHNVIRELCKLPDSPYAQLRSLFVVGRGGLKEARVVNHRNGQNAFTSDADFSHDVNNLTSGTGKPDDLRLFRDNTCNVLISTSVTEEGLDVPQCNLIIRFNLPTNYRGFIQSKGRARAKNSRYYVMVPDAVRELAEKRINHFLNLYKEIVRACANRVKQVDAVNIIDNAAEDRKVFLMPPYKTRAGGEINMYNSVSTLHQYCQTMASTSLSAAVPTKVPIYLPRFQFKEQIVPPSQYHVLFGELGEQLAVDIQRTARFLPNAGAVESTLTSGMRVYSCMLIMPSTGEQFAGGWMPTRMTAKQTACQLACQNLHKLGKLNENLMPRSAATPAVTGLLTSGSSPNGVALLADKLSELAVGNSGTFAAGHNSILAARQQQPVSLTKQLVLDALRRK